MNWFSIWTIAGWSVLGLIVLGIGVLVFAMWKDAKERESRDIAAPTLGGEQNDVAERLFEDSTRKEKSPTTSRRSLRNSKSTQVVVEDSSEGSLWADDEDGFNLTEGRD